MKKALLLLVMLFCAIVTFAQSQSDVIYLRNGSTVRGTITDEVPADYVKIRTNDGNTYTYYFREIKEIQRASANRGGNNGYNNGSNDYSYNEDSHNSAIDAPFRPFGYRGFFEWAWSTRSKYGYTLNSLSLTTSHGIQINPYFFIGTGFGFIYYYDTDYFDKGVYTYPIYADFRANFTDTRVSPYLDTKIGYSVGDDLEGFYFSPTVGVDIACARYFDVYFGLGGIFQKFKSDDEFTNSFALKFGIHF